MVQRIVLFLVLAAVFVVGYMVSKVQKTVTVLQQSLSSGDFSSATPNPPAMPTLDLTAGGSPKVPAAWENLKDPNALRVFLSYDVADFAKAKEVAGMLEKTGNVSVFLPHHELENATIDEDSKNAMMFMDCFVVLFTPAYAHGQVTNQEYGFAAAISSPRLLISSEVDAPSAGAYAGSASVMVVTGENSPTIGDELVKFVREKQAGVVSIAPEMPAISNEKIRNSDDLIFE